MPSFGLGVTQSILPWFRGPRPGLGRFNSPFGAFPPPPPPPAPKPVAFFMVMPYGISFTDWAASLVVDFPHDFVPFPLDEASWQNWASDLVQSPTFYNQNAPLPDQFSSWQDWAVALYKAMVPSNSGTI